MICSTCRKDNPSKLWDRIKHWLVWHVFPNEVQDEKTASSTQQFTKGYIFGREEEKKASQVTIDAYKEEIDRLKAFKPSDILTIHVEDVIKTEGQGAKSLVYLGGNKITTSEADILKREAQQLKQTRIWRLIQETVRAKAIEKGHYLSKDWEDLVTSRAMLANLGIQQSIVDVCSSLILPVDNPVPTLNNQKVL